MFISDVVVRGSALAVGTLAVEGIAAGNIATVTVLAGTVGAIVGVVAWIDGRIRRAIADHSEKDMARHELVLAEIRHVRELMQKEDA